MLTNRLSVLFATAVLLLAAACSSKEVIKSPSGLEYTFLKVNKDSAKVKQGDFVQFHVQVFREQGDSLIYSSYQFGEAQNLRVSGKPQNLMGKYMEEGLLLAAKGDSLAFSVLIDSLAAGKPLPPNFKSGDKLKYIVKVIDIKSYASVLESAKKDFFAYVEQAKFAGSKQYGVDSAIIAAHLAKNKLQAQQTPEGLYYVVTQQGTGEKANFGNMATVHYTGKTLDGKQFDSSVGKEPFKFVVGAGQVIPGWDIALAQLNKGAKATIFLPSYLGYGAQGAGEDIKPNAVLQFDIEVIEISNEQ